MALDITIYSALLAAWHFKWANRVDGTANADFSRSYIERPWVYENRVTGGNPGFQVLYDFPPADDGAGSDPVRRCPEPFPSPGTPRHPAYTSGHSTYSAAASRILAYFFPDATEALDDLADNIGVARLWAGVHWRQDHTAGQTLGRAVADRVIEQLRADPVQPLVGMEPPKMCDGNIQPPTFRDLNVTATGRRRRPSDPQQDVIPPPPIGLDRAAGLLGPNRGAVAPDQAPGEGQEQQEGSNEGS